jgi:hypothetical protein
LLLPVSPNIDLPHSPHRISPESGTTITEDLQASYPHHSAVPRDEWRRLVEAAEHEIGILVYSGLFLAEDVDLMRTLAAKARAGVSVGCSSAIRTARRSPNVGWRSASTTRSRPRCVTRSSVPASAR